MILSAANAPAVHVQYLTSLSMIFVPLLVLFISLPQSQHFTHSFTYSSILVMTGSGCGTHIGDTVLIS